MFHRLALGALAVALTTTACDRRPVESQGAPPPATSPTSPAAPSGADMTLRLAELTQALRKFSFEQKRFPTAVDELISKGYAAPAPEAPPGARFVIDPKKVQVVLARP